MLMPHDKVPDHLLGKVQLIATVTFAALFSVFFFIAAVPSLNSLWPQLEFSQIVDYALLFYCAALLWVIVSRRVMYACRAWVGRHFGRYLLWTLCEVIVIAGGYVGMVLLGEKQGLIHLEMPLGALCVRTFLYCLLTLGIPYLIAGLYFAVRDRDQTIRMINYGNVVSDEVLPSHEEQKITLFDNSGVMRLSVSAANLYYIESDDNYVKVWYTDSLGEMKQYMLRCRLKTIEESFADSDLIRCNRKYVVNMEHVRVLRKLRDNYVLELDNDAIPPLPITKTYEENVLARFNSTYRGE